MIVKVQRAIMPPDAPALFYNRARTIEVMRNLSKQELAMFGEDMKAYFAATFRGGAIILQQRVEDQDW